MANGIFLLDNMVHTGHYDENRQMVVIAAGEDQAREIANNHHYEEGAIWNDPEKASCRLIGIALKTENPDCICVDTLHS